jgi:GNAT superfamily N-acetyltransferase
MAEPVIRLLTPEDLDSAFTLSSTAGWNQRLADWRALLALAPRSSFAALIDHRVMGTAMGIDYGCFGWIAMMLVDPAHRGRGLGRRLLEAAMESLPPDQPIRLDATPMGRPLYQACGFEDETMLHRYVTEGSADSLRSRRPASPAHHVRSLTPSDMAVIASHDAAVFGGNRRQVLEWVAETAPHYARIVDSDPGPIHYCLGREGRLFDQIGPVIARDEEIAQALVGAALAGAEDRPVALDVFEPREGLAAWLGTCGFRVQRPLFRMRRPAGRAEPSSVDPLRSPLLEFAILGPEFA